MKSKKTLINKIINLMYDERREAFYMEDPYGIRAKLYHYAHSLLKLIGYKVGDKIKPEHDMIFRLTWLVEGDDEPFSDCGIDKIALLKELENLKQLWKR